MSCSEVKDMQDHAELGSEDLGFDLPSEPLTTTLNFTLAYSYASAGHG